MSVLRRLSHKNTPNPSDPPSSNLQFLFLLMACIWVGILVLLGFVYLNSMRGLGIVMDSSQYFALTLLALAPLLILSVQYQIFKILKQQATENNRLTYEISAKLNRLEEDVEGSNALLAELRSTQNVLVSDLLPYFGTKLNAQIRNKNKRAQIQNLEPIHDVTPSEPEDIKLRDIAHVLNFADQDQKGDWAKAFSKIAADGEYLELIRMAEDLLEIFEQDDIYVEDIDLKLTNAQRWIDWVNGDESADLSDIAQIDDIRIVALSRSRINAEEELLDRSTQYQKQFLTSFNNLIASASEDDVLRFIQSRGGKLFLVLGENSGLFEPRYFG